MSEKARRLREMAVERCSYPDDVAACLAGADALSIAAVASPDAVEGQCPRCGERDGSHAADCRHWMCDHCGHDREAHRDGLASRLERDGHFHPCKAEQAHGYLSRVFTHHAPQCAPLPDLMGVCTQIDNLLAGMAGASPERCGYVHEDGWTCGRAKGHPSVHVPPSRMANPPAQPLREMQHAPRPDCDAEGWHLCAPPADVPACPDGQHSYRRNAPPQPGDVCFVCRKSIWM